MTRRYILLVLGTLSAALSVGATRAAQKDGTRTYGIEVQVKGMSFGNFRDFKADGERGIFLQGRGSNWYYAEFARPCPGMQFARVVGATSASDGDTFDRRSQIFYDGNRCQLKSVVTAPRPYGKFKDWRPGPVGE